MQIVIFDGICNLCEISIKFIIRHDVDNQFKFLPLQSPKVGEYNIDVNDFNSVLFIDNDKVYHKSDAALRILKYLKTPLKYLYFFRFIPKSIRDSFYDFIATNRYKWFGKKESCLIPNDEIKSKFLD